jgi:hypothetical protein
VKGRGSLYFLMFLGAVILGSCVFVYVRFG